MLLFGILDAEEIYRAINWTTVILVGAMMPLSTAITETGAAQPARRRRSSTLVGGFGPRALLAGLFVLTADPRPGDLATPPPRSSSSRSRWSPRPQMGLSPQPVLMCVAVAAAAAFLTPVATPTNLMVMEPGGYRFGDYWKFGLPMMLWFFVIAVGLVPVIWHVLTVSSDARSVGS